MNSVKLTGASQELESLTHLLQIKSVNPLEGMDYYKFYVFVYTICNMCGCVCLMGRKAISRQLKASTVSWLLFFSFYS